MGNILRRVTAFLLGIVFTVTAMVGGTVGGAYYAYKNVSPIEAVLPEDPGLGDIYGASIEQLVDLITNAMDPEKNGEYTFERLAEEYGLDLEKLLTTMGVDVSEIDKESGDWKALEGISILSALSSPEALLDSVKLKALYVLAPAFLDGPIDNFLSPEAQSALGDYTLSELIGADEATGELGIVKAIKGLKIGSFLPEIFDSSFDVNTHEYVYTVKQDGALKDLTFLNLIAGVPLQGIFNIAEGKDAMTELMEGELKSITHTPISDILNMFADVAGEETAKTIAQYTQVFGDTSIADMFVKNDAGKYEFAYENLLSGLELGYLVGYTKDENGQWVDKEGKPAEGLLGFVAGISIGDILDNKDDVVGMINAAIGDLSIMTIYETIFDPDENGRYPVIIERLGTIKVSDILGDGKDAIVDNLKLSLKLALEGTTLRDAVYSFVDESVQEKLESIAIVDKLLDIKLDAFIRDEYTAQDIIRIFNDAIGDMTIGEIAGVEPSDDALGLLMDYRIGNILEGVIAILDGDKSPTEIVDSFIGQYRVGDIFGAFTGYTYDEAQNNWGKDGKFVAKGLIPLMTMPISRFVAIFDKEYDFDIMSVVGDIQIADVAYTVLLVCGIEDILVETDLGDRTSYLLGGDLADFGPLSKVVLTLTVNDFVNNAANVDFWLDRLGQISIGDLSAYLINQVLPLEIKVAYGEGKWFTDSEYLQQLISNVLNTTVGGIIDAFKTGDPEVIKQKIMNKVGDTNVGELVHAALGLAGQKNIVVKEADKYIMASEYSDFDHLADALFGLSVKDIVENASNVDWWFEKLGGIRIGDPFVYFINKYATEMSVSEGENGDWTVTGTMGTVLTGLFNITVGELRDPDAVQLVKDTFGDVRIGDVVESFLPENIVANGFVKAICDVTVNDIINMSQSETMADLVYALQEVFEGVTIGTVTELFGLEGYDYGLFGRILGTEFEFLLGLLITPDIKGEIMYEYGDISLGEVVYTVLKVAGIENILGTKTVDGKEVYVTIGDFEDFAPLSEKLLSVTVEEVLNNLNGEYWLDRLGKITIGDLSAYIVNKLIPLDINLVHDGKKWTVEGEYLTDLLGNVFNTSIGGIVDAFTSGDPELIKQKIANKLGDTNVGDILYAALGMAGVTDVVNKSDSECGYELTAKFEELNGLAQAVMGLKLADIVTKYNDGQYWLDSFGGVTVGDCIDILLPDEIQTNAFLEATRGISVSQVEKMVKAEALADIIIDLQETYDGVMISHILELAGITEISNPALANLADTEIEFFLGLATAGDILGELAYEFKDVTLKAAVGDILANYIDVENVFIAGTLGFGVDDLVNIIGAQTADDALNVIYNMYSGVFLGDVVKAFYSDDIPNNATDTIFGVQINELIKAIAEKRILKFLYEKFGDVRIGDIVFTTDTAFSVLGFTVSYDGTAWSAKSDDEQLSDLFTNILNLKLSTIYDDVAAQENLKNDLVELVGETTIGNLGNLAYNNELGIGVLDKLYALKLADIITNAFDGTILDYLKEFAFDISIGDLVGFLLSEDLIANKFISKTLDITTNTVLGIIDMGSFGPMLNEIAYVYDGVNFSDIFALFGLTETSLNVLDRIFNAGLDDLLVAIGDQTIVDYVIEVFGPVSVNDIVADVETLAGAEIIPADLYSNRFVVSVLGIDVQMVYDLATGANVLETLGNQFKGATLGNVVEIFTAIPEIDYVQTICSIDIGETLLGIYNNDNTALTDKLKTAFDQLPQEVKFGIYAGVAVAGTILYFADNPLLCQIVDGVLGEDAIWGDVLSEGLGYETTSTFAAESSVYYKNALGYNSLMDTFFKEDVTDTLTTGYPFLDTFKNYITIANILTAYTGLTDTITNAIGMEIIQTEKGFALGNEFKDFSDNLFNLSLGDFMTAENGFKDIHAINGLLYNTFDKNEVGDLIAYFVNIINVLETTAVKENGKWTVTGELFPSILEGGMNVTLGGIYRGIKAEDKTPYYEKALKIVEKLNIGETLYTVLKLLGVTDFMEIASTDCGYAVTEKYAELDKVTQKVFGITIVELIKNFTNKDWWVENFNETTLGDLSDIVIPDNIQDNNFVAAVRGISLEKIISLVKAEDTNALISELQTIFTEDVVIADILWLANISDFGNEALAKLLDTDISFLLGLVVSEDVLSAIRAEFYDITIGDAIQDYITIENNAFLTQTYSFSVDHVFQMMAAETPKEALKIVRDIYAAVTFGDLLNLAGDFEIENQALRELLEITIGSTIDVIISDDILTAAVEVFKGITLGDAIGAPLANYVDINNKFIAKTLGINIETVVSLIKATTTEDLLAVFKGVYEEVILRDIVSIFAPEFAAPSNTVDTIFDLELNAIVEAIVKNNLFNFLYETFGDETIGDIVCSSRNSYQFLQYVVSYDTAESKWKAESENKDLDELLTNILNLRLGTIYDDVAAQETLKEDLKTVVGNTTLGEIGRMVFPNEEGIGAVDKLYKIKFADIIESAFNGTILEFFRRFVIGSETNEGITIHDLVGFLLPETIQDNPFVKGTLSISANTIIEMVNAADTAAVLRAVADLYKGDMESRAAIFADIFELFGLTEAPLTVLEPVFEARIYELIEAIANGTVADYVMGVVGGISASNIITDVETLTGMQVIPEELKENNFVEKVLAIDVQMVYDLATGANVLETLGNQFKGATIGHVVEIFTPVPEVDYTQTFCSIDIGETLLGFYNNDNTVLFEKLKTSFDQHPQEVKLAVYAVVAVAGGILYVADNPLLCRIVDGIFGEDATWGDLFADTLGYALNGTYYNNEIGYNSLMDTFFKEDVTETLTTGYPLLNNFKAYVTAGNIITAYSPLAIAIENTFGMNFIETEKGFAFGNEFKDFTDNLFNLSLDNFLTEDNKLKDIHAINSVLYETFNMNNVGDVTAYFVNRFAVADTAAVKENGQWTVTGNVLPKVIANAMNVTFGGIYRGIKAEDKTYYIERAIQLFGDTNVGDIIYSLIKSSGAEGIIVEDKDADSGYSLSEKYVDFNNLAQIFLGIKLVELVRNITNKEYWLGIVGEISLGDVANHFLPDTIKENKFIVETTSVTVNNVIAMAKAQNGSEVVDIIASVYEESTINDVVMLTGKDLSGNRAMDQVLDTKIKELLEIVTSGDIVSELIAEFGDITIGDMFGPELTPENEFLKATYDINVKTIADLALDFNKNNLLATIATVYDGVTIDDAISMAGDFETSVAWLNTAMTLDIGKTFNAVATGDYTYVKQFAKSVYEVTTDGEKFVITAAAVSAGSALYFVNNELLCKILSTVFGEDATFGKFATMFGYTYENGEYTLNGLHNELMTTLFNEKMTVVLADGYPMAATFKPLVTIGNVLTMHSSILGLIEKTGMTIEEAEDGSLMLRGYLANISKSVFSLSLNDILDSQNRLLSGAALHNMLYAKFHANKLGDVLGFILNNQKIISSEAFYDVVDGEWVVTGTAPGLLGRLLNVDFGEVYNMLKTKNYSVIGRVLGDVTLLDVASFVNSGIANNATAKVVLSLKVKDVINCVRGKVTLGSLIGDWTLMEIAGDYLPDMIDKDAEFTKALLGMTLREVNGLRTDAKNKLMDKFGDFTFAEALGFVGYDAASSDDEIVKAVLELKLNIFEGGINAGLDTIINTVKGKKTGVLLGYEEIDGKWYHNGTEVSGILATIAGKTVNELSDPTFLNELTIGEALGYTKNADDKWLDDTGAEVTGVLAAFADTTINEFSNLDIKTKIEGLKLGEVIEIKEGTHKILEELKGTTIGGLSGAINELKLNQIIDIDANNKILKALENSTLLTLSNDINDMYLGTIMGYEQKADGKWYNGATEVTDGLALLLVNKTVGKIGNGRFIDELKNDLKVKVLFPDAGPGSQNAVLRLVNPDWRIVDLHDKLTKTFEDGITVKQAMELKLFGGALTPEVKAALKLMDPNWESWKVEQLLQVLVEKAFPTGSNA